MIRGTPLPRPLRVDAIARAILRRTGQTMESVLAVLEPVDASGPTRWWSASNATISATPWGHVTFVATHVDGVVTLIQGGWGGSPCVLRTAHVDAGRLIGPTVAVRGQAMTETVAAACVGRRLRDVVDVADLADVSHLRIVEVTQPKTPAGDLPLVRFQVTPDWRMMGRSAR
jgi:hypothetical protein